jgi:hypothetical protein
MVDNISKISKKIFFLKLLFVFLIIFGIMTIIEGGAVSFDIGKARINSGNYIPFVLWFNFISGFFYIITGIGLLLEKKWASKLSLLLLISILIVYLLLFIYILLGGLYEIRTIIAMGLRTTILSLTFFASLKMFVLKNNILNKKVL